ncbi:MAG: hypothetical protein HETSPECPRED_006926 [Heterodermia speciosa]|uniref:Core-binding (CB) domain-containing protein n=1 Tax=Heterodermia speciosa TaxID=116794 RepID=A0A8H3FQ83_9LECA|nr:MAG: hypothetical protein HETSPECPRED_006926 [Heterodermia speciosa]
MASSKRKAPNRVSRNQRPRRSTKTSQPKRRTRKAETSSKNSPSPPPPPDRGRSSVRVPDNRLASQSTLLNSGSTVTTGNPGLSNQTFSSGALPNNQIQQTPNVLDNQAFLNRDPVLAARPAYGPDPAAAILEEVYRLQIQRLGLEEANRLRDARLVADAQLLQPRVSYPQILAPVTIRPQDPPESWYNQTGLDRNVSKLLYHGLAPKTRENYSIGARNYHEHCAMHGLRPAFPATVDHLLNWLGELGRGNLKAETIKKYLAGVKSHHIDIGCKRRDIEDVFSHALVKRAIRGIRRIRATRTEAWVPR